MIFEFYKYQATGNDFIIIDDREELFDIDDSNLIKSLCERKMGVGADGLILLRNHNSYDFEMIYFNSDGNQSTLCGNGARCIVSFANTLDIISSKSTFLAIDGLHQANIYDKSVSIKFNDIKTIQIDNGNYIVDSGSPHFITFKDNIENLDVESEGRSIRNMGKFSKDGINVNFVSLGNSIRIRTYERGVESETLSCGTGAVAASIALFHSGLFEDNEVDLQTNGGLLSVTFDEFNGVFKNIWLTGEANLVYIGEFEC